MDLDEAFRSLRKNDDAPASETRKAKRRSRGRSAADGGSTREEPQSGGGGATPKSASPPRPNRPESEAAKDEAPAAAERPRRLRILILERK